jgi:hypothetical protein
MLCVEIHKGIALIFVPLEFLTETVSRTAAKGPTIQSLVWLDFKEQSGFPFLQATKALREGRGIALLCF